MKEVNGTAWVWPGARISLRRLRLLFGLLRVLNLVRDVSSGPFFAIKRGRRKKGRVGGTATGDEEGEIEKGPTTARSADGGN